MKVSVMMITYNHEHYIAQAIESVLMQRVNFDYELVIGEDCSTDSTREIVVGYRDRYPDKIRLLLSDTNIGARRNVLRTHNACQGQYVAVLEGDDYWTDPLKLQKQVDLLGAHPEWSLCFHRVLVLYEDGSSNSRELGPEQRKEVYSLEDYLRTNLMQTGSIVFRRDALPTFPQWDYRMQIGDWALVILLAQRGDMGYIDEVMSVYRKHSGGIWSGQNEMAQIRQQLLTLGVINEHLKFHYREAIEARNSELCADIAGLLARQEIACASAHNHVSRPVTVLENSGVRDSLSSARQTQLLREFYTSLFFALHKTGKLSMVRDCLGYAIRYNPALLGNPGVWSIATEAILGQHVAGQLRRAARGLLQKNRGGAACTSGRQDSL
jgi:glycosyltransferase involved in cell wall biosynthesis